MRKLRPILVSVLALASLFALVGAAAARCVPGEVLAVFKGEGERVSALSVRVGLEAFRAASIAAAVGARVEKAYPNLSEAGNGVFVRLSGAASEEELVRKLLQRDDVLAASPNYVVQTSAREPNDPGFPALWGLKAIKAPEAWQDTTGADDVYVAVMDTGIDTTAQSIELAKVDGTLSRSFVKNKPSWQDEEGHGTHVAGTIGARGNNNRGVVGVNWNVKLISLRTMDEDGAGPVEWMIEGVEYLIGLLRDQPTLKLAALNASLGWYAPVQKPGEQGRDAVWQVLKALDATNRVVFVAAAGNERTEVGVPAPRNGPTLPGTGEPLYKKGECVYPASYRGLHNMIAVGAVSTDLTFAADFSNYSGTYVDIAAPGVNILSTTCAAGATGRPLADGTRVAILDGTSMAAPHVAGAAALLKAADPTRTAYQIRTALIEGAAKNQPALAGKVAGGRLLDVRGALDYQRAHGDLPSAPNQPSIPDQPPSPSQPETPGGPDDAPGSNISASYIQLDSDRVANGVDLSFTLMGCRYDEAAKRAQIKDHEGKYVEVQDMEVLIDDTPVQHDIRSGSGDSARIRVPAVEIPRGRAISLRVRARTVSGGALLTTRYKSVEVGRGQKSGGGSSGGGCDAGLGAVALALPLLALSARRRRG